jgi:hypothetical protein
MTFFVRTVGRPLRRTAPRSRERLGRAGAPLAVAALLAALFGALEAHARWSAASSDARDHVGSLPARAAVLVDRPGVRVALVGNSTTRQLDTGAFAGSFRARGGRDVAAETFAVDGSYVNTWRYVLEQCFWRPKRRPDLFVVNFCDRDLEDGNALSTAVLARRLTTPADWPEVLREDLSTVSQRADFLLCAVSASYARREYVREPILRRVVPGYSRYRRRSNDILHQEQRLGETGGYGPAPTHRALERLLRRARQTRSEICFVAYPTAGSLRGEGSVNPESVRLIREAGMSFVDLGRTPALRAEHYTDRVHLTEAGSRLYSRRLAAAIARTRTLEADRLVKETR